MKIVSINHSVKSMKLTVPFDGNIDIDANGIAEVSDKCAEALVKGTKDWKYLNEDKNSIEDGKGEGDVSDKEIKEGINKMSLEEMIELAKESNYPESEWDKFAKNEKNATKLMSAYLFKMYKKTKANDPE